MSGDGWLRATADVTVGHCRDGGSQRHVRRGWMPAPPMARAAVVVWVGLVVLSSCVLPGVEEPTPEYSHSFRALDPDGDPIAGSALVFSWTDLNGYWSPIDRDADVPLFAGQEIVPNLGIDTEELDLDEEDRLCLSEPIVFMWAESLEVVHEIPAGTCLEDNGRTEFTVDAPPPGS